MAMLAPDVVFTSDSDGKVSAARRPVLGRREGGQAADRADEPAPVPSIGSSRRAYNSSPAMIVYRDEQPDSVFTIEVIDGKITNFYAMRNPEKLASVTVRREISR